MSNPWDLGKARRSAVFDPLASLPSPIGGVTAAIRHVFVTSRALLVN
jgi:hypothetical protein